MRQRRGKAPKQEDGRLDMLWEEQQHGGSRKQRFRQSRVRSCSAHHYRFLEEWQSESDQVLYYEDSYSQRGRS